MTDIKPTDEQVIRNYYVADEQYRERLAEELEKLGDVAAQDVREAKAHLNVPKELRKAVTEARIAFSAMNAEKNERWIAAHEDLAVLRQAGQLPAN